MPKRGWVISGGGARIVQALEVIEGFLKTGGREPDVIVGTSAGGLLAILIGHLGVHGARKELLKIGHRQQIFGNQADISKGLWSCEPLQRLIREVMQHSRQIDYYVCAYDLIEQQKVYFKHKDGWYHAAATACIPGIVSPLDGVYVDGGLVENTPLGFAIDLKCTELEVFSCSATSTAHGKSQYPKNVLEVLAMSLEAMSLEMAKDDVKTCLRCNEIEGKKKVSVRMHSPKGNKIGVLEFDQIRPYLLRNPA